MLSREKLVLVKRLAIRKRVWFRVLDGCERAIVSLTIRCVDIVRSARLAGILTSILEKLNEALKSGVERLMETAGRKLAQKIAAIAVSWGNLSAFEWAFDNGFVKFLTIMELNRASGSSHDR